MVLEEVILELAVLPDPFFVVFVRPKISTLFFRVKAPGMGG